VQLSGGEIHQPELAVPKRCRQAASAWMQRDRSLLGKAHDPPQREAARVVDGQPADVIGGDERSAIGGADHAKYTIAGSAQHPDRAGSLE